MNPTVADETVNHYGPILIRRGYEWVELEDVAHASALDLTQITKSFPNKALLCNAWMEKTDARTKKHHTLLLKSGQPPRDILKIYFDELKKFMEEYQFSGCPYTNTARALRDQPDQWITDRTKEHKNEIRHFFKQLCQSASHQPDTIAESLFLIYSGATTESANIKSLDPVKAGSQAALALFDLYSKA